MKFVVYRGLKYKTENLTEYEVIVRFCNKTQA